VNGCFVLGLDGQTPEIFDQIQEFVWEAKFYDVQITIQTPFPGTPLLRRLRQEGRILQDSAWERCTLFDVNFRPRSMSVEQLEKGFRTLAVELYSDAWTRHRRRHFEKLLRARRRQRGREES